MRMLNTRISCRTWKIHTTNDPTFIDSVEEKIYMKPCTMQSWGFPVFLWTQWLKTPLMMVHPHFLVCWIPTRVQFLLVKWPCLLMNSSQLLVASPVLRVNVIKNGWNRHWRMIHYDRIPWNMHNFFQLLVPSFFWFPVPSMFLDSHLHVGLIPVSGSAGMLLGRLVSWKQRSAAFNARHEKCFPRNPLIQSISILFKVIQMCFFRFDSLTQFCVLFWLSQGWTARTLDLPMKIIGFWAQSQQQREHWSSKARGNELKMCMWSGNGWGCKQWISVM